MTRIVVLVLATWLALALIGSGLGFFRLRPPPFPQLVLAGLVLAQIAAAALSARLRGWLRSVPIDALVALHVTRLFAGAAFLALYGQGRLPWAFAVPGGWGDIAVGFGALALAGLRALGRPAGPGAYALWNVLGLIDILGVIASAARSALRDPASMRALIELPLAVLPGFLVPLIVFTHLVLAVRLRPGAARAG
jgi:hypothetical protein